MTQQTFRLPAIGVTARRSSSVASLRRRPGVLYVHGATFPSALSVGFDFGDGSWLDDWNARGFDAWAFDFAGFGESGRYAAMAEPADRHPPLGRAPEAAEQVAAVLALIRARPASRACRWSRIPGARCRRRVRPSPSPTASTGWSCSRRSPAAARRQRRRRCRLGATSPTRRSTPASSKTCRRAIRRCWRPSTAGRRPISRAIPTPRRRTPPAVRIPNGPRADNIDAWAGRLSWDPAGSRGRSPSCAAPGIRSAATPMRRRSSTAATAAPSRHDCKLDAGTHLMHLETGRRALYDAVGRALKGEQP